MTPRIVPSNQYPDALPQLAMWQDAQWRHLNPAEYDLAARLSDYQQVPQQDALPQMLVALQDDLVLGSVRLTRDDMETHHDWFPWLASLYVHEPYRQQGVGRALILEAIALARSLSFTELYLFTTEQQALYQKFGWQEIQQEVYYAENVTVMRLAL